MSQTQFDILIALLRASIGSTTSGLTETGKSLFMPVVQLAGEHCISSVLCDGLKNLIAEQKAPGWAPLVPMLKALSDQNVTRNRQVREVCLSVNRILRADGIEPVFLKGTAFILEDHNSAPWRFVSDIDILVPGDQVAAAASCLAGQGYLQTGDPRAYHPRNHHHYPALLDPSRTWSIEIHSRVMLEGHLAELLMPDIYSTRREVMLDHEPLAIPANEFRLSHLVAHAQISNLGQVLRHVSLRDMLDANSLLIRKDANLPRVQQSFAAAARLHHLTNFLAAFEKLAAKPSRPGEQLLKPNKWAESAFRAIEHPPSPISRSTRLGLHYLRTLVTDPRRLIHGAKVLYRSNQSGHAARILARRTGRHAR